MRESCGSARSVRSFRRISKLWRLGSPNSVELFAAQSRETEHVNEQLRRRLDELFTLQAEEAEAARAARAEAVRATGAEPERAQRAGAE